MKTTIFAASILTLAVSALPANAQDDEPDCSNPVTQADMNICAGKEYEEADAALNAAYKSAMVRMQSTDKELGEIEPNYVGAVEALKKAQRGWIQYRDGQCDLAGFEARGGSMEPMLVSGCLADLTRKRTQELKELLTDSEQ